MQQSRREGNRGRDKNVCGVCGQNMMDGTNATEFKIGCAEPTRDVKFHGQVTVKCNTKVFDKVRHGNRCTTS